MAETATLSVPDFARIIAGKSDEDALDILQLQHPDYKTRIDSWTVLLDAFEGVGGFLNGGYLWPYPREDSAGFVKRQFRARYHNYLENLVDLYVRFIFTQGVKRDSTNQEYNDWTEDVDGAGTTLTEYMKEFASVALVHGHAGTLVDKTRELPEGPTKADEMAQVTVNLFPAVSIPDWRFERDRLAAVKLFETGPEPDLTTEMPTGEDAVQYLLWDKDGWARFDSTGKLIDADLPMLGMVPLVILRPKPSYLSAMLGRPLISNANIIRALFNRNSEEDEVLRDQAFSLLTVSVPQDGSVDNAKTDLGSEVGTTKAIVVRGTIDYKTPSQEVPGTIRENADRLIEQMYRSAHVRFRRESLQAESGESIRLQYTELNEMLQGFAKGLAQAEREIARGWFGWMTTTPEEADAAFEAAEVVAEYPSEFFLDALIADLEAWAEGIRMDLGPTMNKRIKKRAVRRIEPELPAEELEKIDAEIDGQSDDELKGIPPMPVDTGDPEGQGIKQAAQAGAVE